MVHTRPFTPFALVLAGLAALLLGSAVPAGAAPAVPDTPVGRQLSDWLRALNAGEGDGLRRFIAGQYGPALLKEHSAEERAGYLGRIAREDGRLAVRRVERSTYHEIDALVEAEGTEAWARIRMRVAAEPPHRIVEESFSWTRRPQDARSPGKPGDAAIVKEISRYVDMLVAGDRFSGTVLVAKDGKPIFKKAYGLASKAYNVPNRIDTKFNLGSMNKMFTAVAIAQLAEHAKLSFNDTVGKLLPDFPNKAVAEKVTIHHLLTHTSGMGSYFNEQFMQASRDRFRSVADYLPLYVNEPLAFEPGARFQYSNSGFMLLGAIVEKVSGKDYFTYVREQIYKPAGMVNTDCYELDRDVPNLATGYTRMSPSGPVAGERRNNLFLHVLKGGPAGGGYSTVEDLLRFDIALRSHKLLNSGSTDLVLTGKVDAPWRQGAKYGYGFGDERVNGKRIIGHGGGFPGLNSVLDIYLEGGHTVAVMSNYDPPAAQRVGDRLREMITQG